MKNGEMLSGMILLATMGHAGQYDKGGVPYILHPLKVMHYLKTADEELMCMAVIHDLFEDTKITKKEVVKGGASKRVIDAVTCLTKQPGQDYDEYKLQVFSNKDAMQVKLCDLRHNSDIRRLKGVTEKDIERIAKYQRFYLEILTKLAV
jgi:(p)ppGpp synthase/HD superfamily hydrolase